MRFAFYGRLSDDELGDIDISIGYQATSRQVVSQVPPYLPSLVGA